jgi:FixJ family two-component response regulator
LTATIHIVDDDASFRASVGRLLQASGYSVQAYASAEALLAQLPMDVSGSCIILDIRMPGLSGPELQAQLHAAGCHVRVVFLSGHGDIATAVQVIKAGAEDVLTKPVQKHVLLAVIEQALARGRKRKDEDDKLAGWRRLVSRLTPREQQVFERVVRGGLNKQIAFELGSTERTIKAHRQHVMHKLQIGSLAELVLMAERLGVFAEPLSQVPAVKRSGLPSAKGDGQCLEQGRLT